MTCDCAYLKSDFLSVLSIMSMYALFINVICKYKMALSKVMMR